ncbi:MAG: hypothetical protein ACK6CT_01100 [Planctomycetia bacterium]|jgi:hypothetical protein
MRCDRPSIVHPVQHALSAGLIGLLCCLTTAGCGGSSGGSARTEPAKATVVAFLDAIKRGDDASASGLLTKLAKAKTQELGISVAPPVADSAVYAVHECEMVSESDDLAHVGTTWTDTDTDGFRTEQNVVWVVRLDPEGWRVAGMAMKVFDDMAPLLLNFEDPEDMLAKQEQVAVELQKRAAAAAGAAKDGGKAQTARGTPPATVR